MNSFEYRNVYSQDYFELRTYKRDKSFRYARYNGQNYECLCQFIKEKSPNTIIWEEKDLTKGNLYTVSGSRKRQGQFHEVTPYHTRCCIVSNPYILVENEWKDLRLTPEEAIDYLLKNKGNRICCYEEIESTYIHDHKDGRFYKINKEHPHGLSVAESEIRKPREWYIVGNDSIHSIDCSPIYDHDMHFVTFEYNLREKADQIIDIIYEINRMSYENNKFIVFNQSWEDTKRYRLLYKKCLNDFDFRNFINTLYMYIYEETKNYPYPKLPGAEKIARQNLPREFRNMFFPNAVGEWRNFYFHGNAEYDPNPFCSIQEVFLSYVGIANQPQRSQEFEKAQEKLLQEFLVYLKDLNKSLRNRIRRKGLIELDKYNNVHCNDILLPRSFENYCGNNCLISKFRENTFDKLKTQYPFFCPSPEYIEIQRKGTIIESNGQLKCGDILIHESLKSYMGKDVLIKKIEIRKMEENVYMPYAYDFDVLIYPYVEDVIRIEDGRVFVSTWELPMDKWKKFEDSTVILSAIHIEKHGKTYEENPELQIRTGIVEKEYNNDCYYCGNVLLSPAIAERFLGRRVQLMNIEKNMNRKYSYYDYYCKEIVLAN